MTTGHHIRAMTYAYWSKSGGVEEEAHRGVVSDGLGGGELHLYLGYGLLVSGHVVVGFICLRHLNDQLVDVHKRHCAETFKTRLSVRRSLNTVLDTIRNTLTLYCPPNCLFERNSAAQLKCSNFKQKRSQCEQPLLLCFLMLQSQCHILAASLCPVSDRHVLETNLQISVGCHVVPCCRHA